MNKKGYAQIIIPASVVSLLVWFFIIGPALEDVGNSIIEELGQNSVCPQEFATTQYKVCFNANGDVIADGQFNEVITVSIDGTTDSCHINTGNYDFQFTGCKLDKFKQLEAYSLVLINSKGEVSLSGKEVIKRIGLGQQIVKIKPKQLNWIRRLLPFIRFA